MIENIDASHRSCDVQHIFIIGSKSIGQYGGYETFVEKLLSEHQNEEAIRYHVACKANGDGFMDETKLDGVTEEKFDKEGRVCEFTYKNAHVFKLRCPNIGPAVAIYYDYAAIKYSIRYCIQNNIEHPIFYILTCRIGLFIKQLTRKIKAVGGEYFLNPDGHEWKRAKWSAPVRFYWKWSEKRMVNFADLVICDSINIEKYIKKEYNHQNTTYIAYGADTVPSILTDDSPQIVEWLDRFGLQKDSYYLVVGRFVPENNYETMLREFLSSHSPRSLVLITNVNDAFLEELEGKLNWRNDERIKFVGTVYDKELLKKIREFSFCYLHGHEVGGTNPSLLEALGSTNLNLLLDVGFNKEVGQDAALYWSKREGELSGLIDEVDVMDNSLRIKYGNKAKKRIQEAYSWKYIGEKYKRVWLG